MNASTHLFKTSNMKPNENRSSGIYAVSQEYMEGHYEARGLAGGSDRKSDVDSRFRPFYRPRRPLWSVEV
jgi:hypothetical protein